LSELAKLVLGLVQFSAGSLEYILLVLRGLSRVKLNFSRTPRTHQPIVLFHFISPLARRGLISKSSPRTPSRSLCSSSFVYFSSFRSTSAPPSVRASTFSFIFPAQITRDRVFPFFLPPSSFNTFSHDYYTSQSDLFPCNFRTFRSSYPPQIKIYWFPTHPPLFCLCF